MDIKKYNTLLCHIFKRYMSPVRRKYPINPADAEKLETLDYKVSKNTYNRIYVWGNMKTGALGVPFLHDRTDKERYMHRPKRFSLAEKYEVTLVAAGFGFSLFAINSDTKEKVFGCGLNTDSQLGQHFFRKEKPLEVIFLPQPIHLPFVNLKSKIIKLAAGRAHSAILSDEGLFFLGNNAYGQCGRKIIPNEDYVFTNFINQICNVDGKKVTDVVCGQDHSLVLTEDGSVYSCGWGADGQTGLGHFKNCEILTKVCGDIEKEKIVKISSRSDFVLALSDKGQVFGWGNTEYSQIKNVNEQQVAHPKHLDFLDKLGKIKDVGAGGCACIVVNENHEVFTWGYGLLGKGPAVQQSAEPIKIPETLFGRNDFQLESRVTNVTCGLFHMAAVSNLGDVYMWGRNKSGCLGLGHDKDQYFPLKVSVSGLARDVSCGFDHSIALCKPYM